MGLRLILDNINKSGYDESKKWQMTLRLNRMIAGIVSDSNPESRILDNYFICLGLNLLVNSQEGQLKLRAEKLLEERL